VVIEALHVMVPVDMQDAPANSLKTHGEANGNSKGHDKFAPRVWYKHRTDMYDLSRMAESAVYLRNVLETQGPFDVRTCSTKAGGF